MRRRALAITGCVVVLVLIAIYASVWFALVNVRKGACYICYDYSKFETSGYFLDQEAADVSSAIQSKGDRKMWDRVFAHRDNEGIYSPFWVPMERVHQLLFGIKTVFPARYIESRVELNQMNERVNRKMLPLGL